MRDAAFRKESSSDGKSFSNAARRVAKRVSKAIATNRGTAMIIAGSMSTNRFQHPRSTAARRTISLPAAKAARRSWSCLDLT